MFMLVGRYFNFIFKFYIYNVCIFSAHNDLFSKKKIILLESSPDRDEFHLQEKFSNRTCALSPATVTLLDGKFVCLFYKYSTHY